MVSQLLMDNGHHVLRLHYRECIHGIGNTISKRLRAGEFQSMWIVHQRRRIKDVPPDRIRRFISEVCMWIRHAKDCMIPICVMGVTGRHWDYEQWDQLILDKMLYESKHRFCSMGLKVDKTAQKPSNVCV